MSAPIGRTRLLQALIDRCQAAPWILAAWEGGSAAFGREDAISDIDLVLVAEAERVEDAFTLVENTLGELSPISDRCRLPEPTWHGHSQAFYRLRDASPDHFIDLVVSRPDAKDLFLQPERHGNARMAFDRIGIVDPAPLDRNTIDQENRGRVESIRVRHRLMGVLPDKELRRGKPVDALAFYQSVTLRHLVELLRIRHDPFRATFGLRYLDHDLPADVRRRLEPLFSSGTRSNWGRNCGRRKRGSWNCSEAEDSRVSTRRLAERFSVVHRSVPHRDCGAT